MSRLAGFLKRRWYLGGTPQQRLIHDHKTALRLLASSDPDLAYNFAVACMLRAREHAVAAMRTARNAGAAEALESADLVEEGRRDEAPPDALERLNRFCDIAQPRITGLSRTLRPPRGSPSPRYVDLYGGALRSLVATIGAVAVVGSLMEARAITTEIAFAMSTDVSRKALEAEAGCSSTQIVGMAGYRHKHDQQELLTQLEWLAQTIGIQSEP